MEKLFYGSVLSDGVKLHYSRTSQGFPPMVLLHGLLDNGLCFGRLAYSLYTQYDVFLPDARGHGKSEAPGGGYDLKTMAGDVRQLVDALGMDTPILLGHSMGAATAAEFAAEYPQSVRALILIDPPWVEPHLLGPDLIEQQKDNFLRRIQAYHSMGFSELELTVKAEHPSWHEDDLRSWAKAKTQVREEVVAVVPHLTEGWQEIAEKIRCDVLLLTADPEKGALISSEVAASLQKNHLNWTIVRIPDAGHNVQREAFAQTKEQIFAFLRKVG